MEIKKAQTFALRLSLSLSLLFSGRPGPNVLNYLGFKLQSVVPLCVHYTTKTLAHANHMHIIIMLLFRRSSIAISFYFLFSCGNTHFLNFDAYNIVGAAASSFFLELKTTFNSHNAFRQLQQGEAYNVSIFFLLNKSRSILLFLHVKENLRVSYWPRILSLVFSLYS